MGRRMHLHREPDEVSGASEDRADRRNDGYAENHGENRFGLRGPPNVWMFLRRANEQTDQIEETRSAVYVIGTSLLFEALIAAWAGYLFWRRDF